ncbi:MAG: CPBP family intramembrane glutamic endopeptidase [Candidatus Heimdallarchaeota archaeon]
MRESVHTNIGYYLGVVAFLVQFLVGFPYLFSNSSFDQSFGQKAILEGLFAMIGLFFTDLFLGSKLRFKPKNFKKIHPNTFIRTGIVLVCLIIAQVLTQFVPMTVREESLMLAILFAGICEELFFRGFIMTFFINAGKDSQNKIKIPLTKKSISHIEIVGILLSSIGFAVMHTNYYNNPQLIFAIFISGLCLGFLYFLYRDLTAMILGHFLLNLICVSQMLLYFPS